MVLFLNLKSSIVPVQAHISQRKKNRVLENLICKIILKVRLKATCLQLPVDSLDTMEAV